MTMRDVAHLSNAYDKTVYRLARKRELPSLGIVGIWRFTPEDHSQWVEERKTGALQKEDDK